MTPDTRQPIALKTVVYSIAGVDNVSVRRDVPYRNADRGPLTIDVYSPPDSGSVRLPAVVLVTGFSDARAQMMFGCKLKEMGSYVSWARLIAASGIAAVTYVNEDPAADVHAVIQHLRQHAEELGLDGTRMGLWSCSGNAPTALSVLMRRPDYLRCAALYYPYTLDADGSTRVAAAAGQFGFVDPCAEQTIGDLPPECSLFIARAGRDQMPGLNETLNRFVAGALTRNLPITVMNHASASHAFDLFDDSETTREIIRQALAFLRFHLLSPS